MPNSLASDSPLLKPYVKISPSMHCFVKAFYHSNRALMMQPSPQSWISPYHSLWAQDLANFSRLAFNFLFSQAGFVLMTLLPQSPERLVLCATRNSEE